MPVSRTFLNWDAPALPAVADLLVDRYKMLETVNLSGAIIVVPGRRAGRRLMELLIESADRRRLRLTPPLIETVGSLPERLYRPQRRFASALVNKFAWTAALRELDDEAIRTVIPDPPADHDISRWLSFGELLWKQHRELAAEGLDFQEVISRGKEVSSFDEADRWQILRTVQTSCLAMLDKLELWDLQSARLFAVKHDECSTDRDIILIGTADLNSATRQMLEKVEDRVTVLVHAPPRLADQFDEFGCIVPEKWSGVEIDLSDHQFCVVNGPSDQATEVVRTMAGFEGKYRVDEVTVGVADERLVPEIQRVLSTQGVRSRWVIGQELSESRPFRLLKAVAEFLESSRFDAFASLLRHMDMDAWICRQAGAAGENRPTWMSQLDDYFSEYLPSEPGHWPADEKWTDQIRPVHDLLNELLRPLQHTKQLLGRWVQPVTELLLAVYDGVEFDVEHAEDLYALQTCRRIHELLLTHEDIPELLTPKVNAAQAIRLLLNELGSDSVPPVPADDAVEILGWLELPLDDAPALVITTFNEGFVPGSLNSDAFLPNAMRRHLGLLDNRRRHARDAYALSVLRASRRQLKLITGRMDVRGDPLRPSRLLFATREKKIAERVLKCFGEIHETPGDTSLPDISATAPHADSPSPNSALVIPRPLPLARPVQRMSVTAFRTYLTCPYRYYLQHQLHLQNVDDSDSELNAMKFGNILHAVLQKFGAGELKDSQSAADIRQDLKKHLANVVEEMLAGSRLAAVNVQLRQLEARLDAFADWQASWAQQGWVIRHCELSFQDRNVQLETADGRSIHLDGRIDRIDQLGGMNQYMIFDYKTGENAKHPRKTHLTKDEWIDLQLPLYRYMVQQIGISGELNLGYIALPKDTGNVREFAADFTEAELENAVTRAAEVAADVLDEKFWPPADVGPVVYSEFAAICQDGAFDREVIA